MKSMRHLRTLALGISALFAANISGKAVIFDFGGVLIDTDTKAALWQIGPLKMIAYAISGHSPFSCRERFFTLMNLVEPHDPSSEIIVRDEEGHPLPHMMCEWLKGNRSSEALLEELNAACEVTHADFFYNGIECSLCQSIARIIFDPEIFVATRTISQEGIDLVRQCKEAGHQVYALSNWDAASLTLIQEQYPAFVELFDGIVISGDCGLIKPDPAIYYYFLDLYNLDARDCIFIDDRPENVEAAESCGITGIVCQPQEGLIGKSSGISTVRNTLSKIISL